MLPSSLIIGALVDRMNAVGMKPEMDNLAMIALHENWGPSDEPLFVANYLDLGPNDTNITIVYVDVPPNMLGILDNAATGVPNIAYWDYIEWRIEIGRKPIPGFDLMMGPFGFVQLPAPVGYPVMPGQRVAWVVNNLTSNTLTNVTGLLRGRFFQAKIPELSDMLRTLSAKAATIGLDRPMIGSRS